MTLTGTYDAVGNRTQLQAASGGIPFAAWTAAFDGVGRMLSLTSPANDNVGLEYDPAGRLVRIQFPNGIVSRISYDLAGRTAGIIDSIGTSEVRALTYAYDEEGKVDTIAEPAKSRSYGYDDFQQLVSSTLSLAGGSVTSTETYAYDGEGNRTSSHLSATHSHDANNRLTGDASFCYAYDANGNLTSKTTKTAGSCSGGQTTTYGWDVQNRLVRIDFPGGTVAQYRYDADGRRIEKDVNGAITRYVYDRDNIVLEYDGANALQARYSHGDKVDQPLVMSRGPDSFFYHADHLGSVREITDIAGQVVNEYEYDSFGRFETRIETVPNPYAFTAREFDPESSLHFYRARYYAPSVGRFIAADPIGFKGKDPNLYRYVRNSPTNYIDPSGTQLIQSAAVKCFATGVGAATGTLLGRFVLRLDLIILESFGEAVGILERRIAKDAATPNPGRIPR